MGLNWCVRFNQLVSLANTYTSFQAGQLLDYGRNEHGSNWTIVRDMRKTPPGHSRDLIENIISAKQGMTFSHCRTLYHEAYGPAPDRMQWYVKNKKMLHEDVNASNVLFDVTLGDAELVDWGSWVGRDVRAKPLLHFRGERLTIVPSDVGTRGRPRNESLHRAHEKTIYCRESSTL
jgi:hypothetical protein